VACWPGEESQQPTVAALEARAQGHPLEPVLDAAAHCGSPGARTGGYADRSSQTSPRAAHGGRAPGPRAPRSGGRSRASTPRRRASSSTSATTSEAPAGRPGSPGRGGARRRSSRAGPRSRGRSAPPLRVVPSRSQAAKLRWSTAAGSRRRRRAGRRLHLVEPCRPPWTPAAGRWRGPARRRRVGAARRAAREPAQREPWMNSVPATTVNAISSRTSRCSVPRDHERRGQRHHAAHARPSRRGTCSPRRLRRRSGSARAAQA
jgi:hypothetical protein